MAHRQVPAAARPPGSDGPPAARPPRPTAAGLITIPRFLVASGTAIGLLAVAPQLTDPDFWWHLRTGQLILASGRLVATDPYTFSAAHHHWVLQEWLTEVWYAALGGSLGRGAIVALFELATLGMLAAILLRARLARPVGAVSLALGAVLAMLAAAPIWGPRPQMETYVLLAAALYCAERQLRRGGRAAWLLPPIFLLWTNLEAGWVVGLALLLVIGLVEGARRWAGGRPGPRPTDLHQLWGATGFSLLAVLVNPNGAQILLYPFQTQFDTVQQQLIQEWHSPDFHLIALLPFLVMLLSLAVLLVGNRRASLRDLALCLVVTPLALQSVRQVAVFAVVVAPVWVVQADLALRTVTQRRGRSAAWARRPPPVVRVAAALEIGVIGLLVAVRVAAAAAAPVGSSLYIRRFPVCAAAWLARGPSGLRLFNLYQDGGYLADHLPRDRIFIFGDAALMGNAILLRFARVADLAPGWLRTLDRSPSQLVVFDRGTPLAQALTHTPSWPLVYQDRRVDVFARARLLPDLRLAPVPGAGAWRRAGLGACIGQRPRR